MIDERTTPRVSRSGELRAARSRCNAEEVTNVQPRRHIVEGTFLLIFAYTSFIRILSVFGMYTVSII